MARSHKAKARTKGHKFIPKKHAGNKFTMQEEARNTEGRNLWRSGLQLRHKAVHFVSAGDLKREDTETPEASEKREQSETMPEPIITPAADQPTDTTPTADAAPSMDTLEEGIANTEIAEPDTGTLQSDQDESSEDEIVFLGRQKRKDTGPSPRDDSHRSNANDTNRLLERNADTDDQQPKKSESLPDATASSSMHDETTFIAEQHSDIYDMDYIDLGKPRRDRRSRRDQRAQRDEDDGILADYIANMDDDYLQAFNDSSSSGEDTDGDNNFSKTTGTQGDISLAIEAKEATELQTNLDTDLIDEDLDLDNLAAYTPEDLTSHIDAQNDAAFNTDSEDNFADGDPYAQEIEDLIRDLEEGSSRNTRRNNRSKGRPFASATAFTDALEMDPYYGLDIMDFDRPSLRNKKKGKHLPLGMVLSDSDLDMELERAWKNDREKKRVKKQQRELLRSQGLLGRRSDDPDLKSKYATSMGFDDLKVEIRNFLLSSKNSLPLPPLTKHRRKVVHDIAHDLSLNSQSRGKGSSRFPILHKTSRTQKYTRKTISQVDTVFSKGKFKYAGAKIWEQHLTKSAKSQRGRSGGAVSYMDGDVVGGSAPEIGAGNKGRAMLEKMGWSTGTALGAANNKGILLPVAHVVKNSKAGLG